MEKWFTPQDATKEDILPYLIYSTKSFMSEHCCRVQVDDSKVLYSPKWGLPKGFPLSPTLFLIFTDDLLMELEKVGVEVQAYVDDILTWL